MYKGKCEHYSIEERKCAKGRVTSLRRCCLFSKTDCEYYSPILIKRMKRKSQRLQDKAFYEELKTRADFSEVELKVIDGLGDSVRDEVVRLRAGLSKAEFKTVCRSITVKLGCTSIDHAIGSAVVIGIIPTKIFKAGVVEGKRGSKVVVLKNGKQMEQREFVLRFADKNERKTKTFHKWPTALAKKIAAREGATIR